ncbi:MAG: LL-diaminopimelate aminotransferase [Opitutales bacterium]
MSDPYIQECFAERIGGRNYGKSDAIYKFEKIKRAKNAALAAHPEREMIDMGVGEPDEMAFPEVVRTLQQEAEKPENRGYSDNGGDTLKQSAARYMANVFGVKGIDPNSQIIHSIGSKTALSMLPACFVNPGDYVLMTTPGYPVLGTHAAYYGGKVYNMPLNAENGFLPDLDAVPADVRERAKIMVLNYPNNPTGASATPEFFEKAVRYARENKLILVHDAAYASLVFDKNPLSILQTPGAEEVAIELHSLSKSFNMTGWRIGFVVGHPLIVQAYGDVKNNSDSGQFLAIQKAAAVALDNPGITDRIAEKYERRMDLLVECLKQAGFKAQKPRAGFFLYLPAPRSATANSATTEFENAEAFSQWLITEEQISTVPWDEAGGFVRLSVTFDAPGPEREQEIVGEIGRRLSQYRFAF